MGAAIPDRCEQSLQDLVEITFDGYVTKPAAPIPGLQVFDLSRIARESIKIGEYDIAFDCPRVGSAI